MRWLLWATVAATVSGQEAVAPKFEVASIRPSALDSRGYTINNQRARINFKGATLTRLISYAYGIPSFQIEGQPGWADDRFDIEATHDTPEDGSNSQRDVRARQRTRHLLAERFGLRLREAKKEMAALGLRQEKSGHKLAPKPAGPGATTVNSSNGNGRLRADGVGMAEFVQTLSGFLGRPVVDETGLAGLFEFGLEWSSAGGEGPSLPTALKEQLGLRLESTRAEVRMFVVESAVKPEAN